MEVVLSAASVAGLEAARCRYVRMAGGGDAWDVLRGLDPVRLLLVGVVADEELAGLVRVAMGYSPDVHLLLELLRSGFPPAVAVPPVPARVREAVVALALGGPGDAVAPGLFPGRSTKLARLALAASRWYAADDVRRAAEEAFARGRPYHGHDAIACALVHPDVEADDIVERITRPGHGGRGWRSRRKAARVVAWGRRFGYAADPVGCRCGHHRIGRPESTWAAARLSAHWDRIRPLLDDELRCMLCGRAWTADALTSGHAELHYGYRPLRPRLRLPLRLRLRLPLPVDMGRSRVVHLAA